MPMKPAIRVIIMHVRHRFPRLAAKFSQIVASRRPTYQRQINRHTSVVQPTRNKHRHIMHPRHMLQRLKRRRLHVQAEQFVDKILAPSFEKQRIFTARFKLLIFRRRQQLKIHKWLRLHHLAFLIKQKTQHRQIKIRRRMKRHETFLWRLVRIEHLTAKIINEWQPTLLRRLGNLSHRFLAQRQHLRAAHAPFKGKQIPENTFPIFASSNLPHTLRTQPRLV